MTTPDLPYDLPTEREVLGAILLHRDAIVAVADLLAADMFYLERHAQVYAAALACYRRREPPDVRMVAAELKRSASPVALADLADLVEATAHAYHVQHHARIVRDLALKRRLIRAGGQIAALGYDAARTAEEATADAQALLTATSAAGALAGFVSARQTVDEMEDAPPDGEGLLTGLHDLDDLIGGMGAGDLLLLGGVPGSGKTTLAVQIAVECARAGAPAGIVSLEMSRYQLTRRLVAYETGLSVAAQRAGLSDLQAVAANGAKARIAAWPLYIEDGTGLRPQVVRTRALRLAHSVGQLGVLVVDYLGLMVKSADTARMSVEMGQAAETMKELARELACPLILCAQLNRDIFRRERKTPTLADIREAGEAPADQALIPMRPGCFNPEDKQPEAQLYLVKNRNGDTGVVPAYFDGPRYRFRNLARYQGLTGYEEGTADDHAA